MSLYLLAIQSVLGVQMSSSCVSKETCNHNVFVHLDQFKPPLLTCLRTVAHLSTHMAKRPQSLSGSPPRKGLRTSSGSDAIENRYTHPAGGTTEPGHLVTVDSARQYFLHVELNSHMLLNRTPVGEYLALTDDIKCGMSRLLWPAATVQQTRKWLIENTVIEERWLRLHWGNDANDRWESCEQVRYKFKLDRMLEWLADKEAAC